MSSVGQGGSSGGAGKALNIPQSTESRRLCGLSGCRTATGPNTHGFCSSQHAKEAVSRGQVPACSYCNRYPAIAPHTYCSRQCATVDQSKQTKVPEAMTLKPLSSQDPLFSSIQSLFAQRWMDRERQLPPPRILSIHGIRLPKEYETRFKNQVQAAEALGGSTTKAAFFGCHCDCQIGVTSGDLEPCVSPSCSVCFVVKKGFDILPFGAMGYEGSLGKGIYASLNPAMAHRFVGSSRGGNTRSMVLCSVIVLDDFVKDTGNKDFAIIENDGRVYCSKKEFILPRQLIIYEEPQQPAASSSYLPEERMSNASRRQMSLGSLSVTESLGDGFTRNRVRGATVPTPPQERICDCCGVRGLHSILCGGCSQTRTEEHTPQSGPSLHTTTIDGNSALTKTYACCGTTVTMTNLPPPQFCPICIIRQLQEYTEPMGPIRQASPISEAPRSFLPSLRSSISTTRSSYIPTPAAAAPAPAPPPPQTPQTSNTRAAPSPSAPARSSSQRANSTSEDKMRARFLKLGIL